MSNSHLFRRTANYHRATANSKQRSTEWNHVGFHLCYIVYDVGLLISFPPFILHVRTNERTSKATDRYPNKQQQASKKCLFVNVCYDLKNNKQEIGQFCVLSLSLFPSRSFSISIQHTHSIISTEIMHFVVCVSVCLYVRTIVWLIKRIASRKIQNRLRTKVFFFQWDFEFVFNVFRKSLDAFNGNLSMSQYTRTRIHAQRLFSEFLFVRWNHIIGLTSFF